MDEQDQIMELDSEMLAALAIAERAEKYPAESDPAEMTLASCWRRFGKALLREIEARYNR